ncbi:MAG: metallophosphoesterase family protein [Clostridia bacterium]|nr:metallophosphoesterase family protein [Clostridia bacterium]
MKIGVLSDTHGLLRPEVLEALSGCAAILHGGDINRQDIIDELERIAPVYVVRGNNDREWAQRIPLTLDFTLGGLRVAMAHKKKDLPEDLSPYDLAVFGHSHKYAESRLGRTLLLNPGSCGPRRFNQAITLAVLEAEAGRSASTASTSPTGAGRWRRRRPRT